jgi:uncharacterized membrane protein YtjA (UPF0391 family)
LRAVFLVIALVAAFLLFAILFVVSLVAHSSGRV